MCIELASDTLNEPDSKIIWSVDVTYVSRVMSPSSVCILLPALEDEPSVASNKRLFTVLPRISILVPFAGV